MFNYQTGDVAAEATKTAIEISTTKCHREVLDPGVTIEIKVILPGVDPTGGDMGRKGG